MFTQFLHNLANSADISVFELKLVDVRVLAAHVRHSCVQDVCVRND